MPNHTYFLDSVQNISTATVFQKYSTLITGSGLVVNPGTGRFGKNALGWAGYKLPLGSDYQHVSMGCAYKPNSFTNWVLGVFHPDLPNDRVRFQHTGDGRLYPIIRDTGSFTNLATTYVMALGIWYYVEAEITYTGISVTYVLRINEQVVSTATISLGAGAPSTFSALDYNGSLGSSICDLYYSVDGPMLGDVGVEYLAPTGPGANTNWTPVGAATNWQAVADAPPDGNASYIRAASFPLIDTYAHAALSASFDRVKAAQLDIDCLDESGGGNNVTQQYRIGGTLYDGNPPASPNGSYFMSLNGRDTSPATGIAYTPAEINAMEIGVKAS